jgi:ribonuclease E
MSRQRLRPSLLEGSTRMCPHCEGRGIVRSVSSCALSVLRAIEEHLISRKAENLTVKCNRDVAAYVLNDKRNHLLDLEASYGISVFIVPSEDTKGSQAQIERAGERAVPQRKATVAPVKIDTAFQDQEEEPETEMVEESEGDSESDQRPEPVEAAERQGNGDSSRRRRRRRGRRGGRRGQDRDQAQAFNGEEREEVRGLGDQPNLEPEVPLFDAGEREASADSVEVAQSESQAGREEQEDRPDRGRGRRDRWGRGRRNRNRHERGSNAESVEQGAQEAPQRELRNEARGEEAPHSPGPAEEPQNEPAEASAEAYQPPKWQPPAPTVAERPARTKSGWWSKRG